MRHLLFAAPLVLAFALPSARALDNLYFYGSLISQPCTIAPGDERVELNFGTVIDKELYANRHTPSQTFTIRLSGCKPSERQNSVSVSFTGTESIELPGRLALEPGSQASGIAIGIQGQDGTPILINEGRSPDYRLMVGENQLRLKARVEGEPQALATRSIAKGPFSAIVTFRLNYE
jgi:type 1 fimbria pilin